MHKPHKYSVPALEKGLDILEALAALGVPQSLTGLADRFERSSSELFRMLNCLERRDYIKRDPASGRFSLTLKLYTLAHTHSVVEKLLHAARGPMQLLSEEQRESCHLSVLERGRLLVVAQEESPEPVRISIEVGSTFDPVQTASGRLLLAHLGEEELFGALRLSPAGTRLRGEARTSFLETLSEVRRRGVSTAESETIEGARDVAVLIGDELNGATAALAITRLERRGHPANEGAIIAALSRAAGDITGILGLSR